MQPIQNILGKPEFPTFVATDTKQLRGSCRCVSSVTRQNRPTVVCPLNQLNLAELEPHSSTHPPGFSSALGVFSRAECFQNLGSESRAGRQRNNSYVMRGRREACRGNKQSSEGEALGADGWIDGDGIFFF